MFTFTSLLGAQSISAASQSLLELDNGAKLLIDVGWDESFDITELDALRQHVSSLSIVLLTHPTIAHLGAYAHCCKHVPGFARVPCYATTPVVNSGRTLLTDLYASSPLAASIIPTTTLTGIANEQSPNLLLEPPTTEEIGAFFSKINSLKYSQPHQPVPSPLSPPLNNLTITAYAAGHTLGGTIWHIQQDLESIVYAADWNQSRENLLAGAAWLSSASGGAEVIEPLRRPTALVCSTRGVEKPANEVLGRKRRDDVLVSLIRETAAQGGKILIPTDSSARVLELAFLLEQTWSDNTEGSHASTYKSTNIYMASKSASSTVKYLQSTLDFMDDAVVRDAEAAMTGRGKGNPSDPLDWRHVRQIERKSQIERVLRRRKPCVVLASDASLEWGVSRKVLEAFATEEKNLVILTEDLSGGLAKQLRDFYTLQAGQNSIQSGTKVVNGVGTVIQIQEPVLQSLNDNERALYEQYVSRQRQLHSTQQGDNTLSDPGATELVEQDAEESSDEEDEDEDTEQQGRALNLSAQMSSHNKRRLAVSDAELGVNVLLRSKNIYDYDVRNKRGKDKIFPYAAQKHRSDEFGEAIRAEDFLRAEERDEIDGIDMRSANGDKSDASIGQKRKWDNAAASHDGTGGQRGGRGDRSKGKKAKIEEKAERQEPDDIDAAIARATGQSLPGQESNGNAQDSSSSDEESDYEPEESTTMEPQKVVFENRSLDLKCRITYVDFMGLHDKRDLEMLIPLIRPRKLILISGTASETNLLAANCRELLSGGTEGGTGSEVFAPVVGEKIDASVDTNAWNLKLSKDFVKKLTWQDVKGLRVVAFSGRLSAEAVEDSAQQQPEQQTNDGKRKRLKRVKDEGDTSAVDTTAASADPVASIPVLELPTAQATALATTPSSQRATQPVHVGDLRLADLRRLLHSKGHTAEFRGEGILLVDSAVVVRKSASGRIEVEAAQGGLSIPQYRTQENEGSFWVVRKAIYGGLAVVAGV